MLKAYYTIFNTAQCTDTINHNLKFITMAYIAVDKHGAEFIYEEMPQRDVLAWRYNSSKNNTLMNVPRGTSLKLSGKQMTWLDEPFELR